MTNPLLSDSELPPFKAIKAEHVVPAISELIAQCRQNLATVVAANQGGGVSWDSLVRPLEEQGDKLNKAWSPVGHLNAVVNSEALREAHSQSLALLTAYGTEVGHHKGLYEAYLALAESPRMQQLDTAQQTAVEHEIRDFKLAGVALPEAQKKRYADIQQRLSELSTKFSNQVLDATQAWYKRVESEEQLAGLPESALQQARQTAQKKGESGYVFTLDLPSYLAVMTHAADRNLREEMYTAYSTRASEVGPNAGRWDNAELIDEILRLRHEAANMLGFDNYAERSLATKMASSCDQVEDFLLQLARSSRPAAEAELSELQAFARQLDNIEDLQAWDQAYYSEKLKQKSFAVSQEELRPYFPADKVMAGLFEVASRLFDIEIESAEAEVWHEDVRFFHIKKQGQLIASFYLDIYARENKRGGAWMDECRNRRATAQGVQLPVAYMVCNFTPPVAEKPSLLTHTEVVTLFHEFGHGLHHMLTNITTSAVSGIHGVAWDAVELPSQFLENWCWEKDVIPMISGHYETGAPLPEKLLHNLLAAKNFQSALQMLRQVEFALFDFRLHRNYDPENPRPVQAVLDAVRREVAVNQPPAFNRFQNSFTHIFAGGYAAGYYSYKWAEVLSSDAFSRFEEEGIFNPATGTSFLQEILQQGGSRDAMTLFKNFRGREPNTEALLRHSGIVESQDSTN
ncbi:MAG: oligopeptidase A [Gammaproteobacteria bacterium]|nr:oligopeptidase A [Gammaproteobacteria bacterium]